MFEASSGDRDFSPGLCPTSRLISTHSANFLEARFGPTSDRNQFVMTIDVMGSPNWFFSQSRKRNRADPADPCFKVRTALLFVRGRTSLALVWPAGQPQICCAHLVRERNFQPSIDPSLKSPSQEGGMAVTEEIAPNVYHVSIFAQMGARLGTPYL